MFLDCLKSKKYESVRAHYGNVGIDNAKECLKQCNSNDDCKFWEMDDGYCRILSTDGEGASFGYPGAISGEKNCILPGSGPKGNFGSR